MTTNVYPKGTALILTQGEYSDFGISACLVTIEDCDMPALAQEFQAPAKLTHPKDPYKGDTPPQLRLYAA